MTAKHMLGLIGPPKRGIDRSKGNCFSKEWDFPGLLSVQAYFKVDGAMVDLDPHLFGTSSVPSSL